MLIGMIALFLCYALILINIAGSLTILAMNLVLGPVFFALSFDRDFRGHAQHWFAAVLSYFMLIPLYGAALTVAATIAGAAVPANLFGMPSSAQVMAQVIGPFMSVGVVFSTNKIVNALVGGAAEVGWRVTTSAAPASKARIQNAPRQATTVTGFPSKLAGIGIPRSQSAVAEVS